MGDCNIDHLKVDSSPLRFFNSYVTEPFSFSQIVDAPTRIASSNGIVSSTLIDLILTTNPENIKTHGVVDTGISDHCLVFMAYSLKKPKFKAKILTRRDFRNFDQNLFLRDMETAPWGNVLAVADSDVDNKVVIVENIYRDITQCYKMKVMKCAPDQTYQL